MKMVRILFIHRFVHLTHKYHALKTRLTTNKCVDEWSTNLWMNECHTNFVSSNKYVCQMCFQCTISMHKTYKLWISEFCMIIIIKSWNRKFMMMFLKIYLIWVQYKHKRYISNHLINISYKWWKSKARCCQERSIHILSFKFKPYLIQCINGWFHSRVIFIWIMATFEASFFGVNQHDNNIHYPSMSYVSKNLK
jgi:hypothetical protein